MTNLSCISRVYFPLIKIPVSKIKQVPPRNFEFKPVITPSPSFWKEASLLLTVFWMYTVYIFINAAASEVLSIRTALPCSEQWRLHSKQTTSPWSQVREQLPASWTARFQYDNPWYLRHAGNDLGRSFELPRACPENDGLTLSLHRLRWCPSCLMANHMTSIICLVYWS